MHLHCTNSLSMCIAVFPFCFCCVLGACVLIPTGMADGWGVLGLLVADGKVGLSPRARANADTDRAWAVPSGSGCNRFSHERAHEMGHQPQELPEHTRTVAFCPLCPQHNTRTHALTRTQCTRLDCCCMWCCEMCASVCVCYAETTRGHAHTTARTARTSTHTHTQ